MYFLAGISQKSGLDVVRLLNQANAIKRPYEISASLLRNC
ncbi:hypothetical protein CZ787_18070 [Halomonas citrativorans]|uniref:Uncharacterized protein n=1 Tax=Halomonas citrativorans TaxID=2742612 RepID=A0A1R4I556_9GAMM|nr:hypothetical protein CZ787_18070 [Halomonas citrativorans]